MQPMDAATGKLFSAEAHYDALIDEGNDPVMDPPVLKRYMDGWDGETFFRLLDVRKEHRALEIGVGAGRLALRALESGCRLVGMDVSEKTLDTAAKHLEAFESVCLLRGEFPKDAPDGPFDRIYSSLTFLHIPDKRAAVQKIAQLLAPDGRAVISLDKSRETVLDMGVRKVTVYPDEPEAIAGFFVECGLNAQIHEVEQAWLVLAEANC